MQMPIQSLTILHLIPFDIVLRIRNPKLFLALGPLLTIRILSAILS